MAITSVWWIKGRVDNMIRYAVNPEKTVDMAFSEAMHTIDNVVQYAANELKTEQTMYVTGINCTPAHAAAQFMKTKQRWNKLGGRTCYHGIQSFKPGEVTAAQAHDLGVALAKELWGERFEVVVATHCNTDCYHNHFVMNSVSVKDGKKFYCMLEDEQRMRTVSDRLCHEACLSVIQEPKGRKKHYAEWKAEQEGAATLRGTVRADIDRAIAVSATKQQFLTVMKDMGYEFKLYGKNGQLLKQPSLRPSGPGRFVRFNGLGDGYTLEDIEKRIRGSYIRQASIHKPTKNAASIPHFVRGSFGNAPKVTGLRALYFCYCYKLKIIRRHPNSVKRVSSALRADLIKLENYVAQTTLLGRERISTMEQLQHYKSNAESRITVLEQRRKDLRNSLKRSVRAEDETHAEALRYRIADISAELTSLRREAKLCSQIAERSGTVLQNLEQLKQQQMKQRKENEQHEYRRRCSRSDRQNEPGRR